MSHALNAIAATVVAFLPVVVSATEYHVDSKAGNDANDGLSSETAFRSLERATKCLKAGDVLNLAPGSVFGESLVFKSGGTAAKPIVVRGNGAIVSGLHPIDAEKWESKGSDLWFQASDRYWGALRPRVFVGDAMISVVANPKELKNHTTTLTTKMMVPARLT